MRRTQLAKVHLLPILVLISLTLFSGCSSTPRLSDEQVLEDFKNTRINVPGGYYELLDKGRALRRKQEIIEKFTDDNIGDVLISVNLADDDTLIQAYYALTYRLYDQGWRLMDVTPESSDFHLIREAGMPDEDDIKSNLLGKTTGYFNDERGKTVSWRFEPNEIEKINVNKIRVEEGIFNIIYFFYDVDMTLRDFEAEKKYHMSCTIQFNLDSNDEWVTGPIEVSRYEEVSQTSINSDTAGDNTSVSGDSATTSSPQSLVVEIGLPDRPYAVDPPEPQVTLVETDVTFTGIRGQFDNLTPGKTYTVRVQVEGRVDKDKTVTIRTDGRVRTLPVVAGVRKPVDPNQYFIQYNDTVAEIKKYDGSTVTTVLTYSRDDIDIISWNDDFTGWDFVGDEAEHGILFSDGSVRIEVDETVVSCVPNETVGNLSASDCTVHPNGREKFFIKNNDGFSMKDDREKNWTKSGIFRSNGWYHFTTRGWIDEDHVLVSNSYGLGDLPKQLVVGRNGTVTSVEDLSGSESWGYINDSEGFIRYAVGRGVLYRVFANEPWIKVLEDEWYDIRRHSYTEDKKYLVMYTEGSKLFALDEHDTVTHLASDIDLYGDTTRFGTGKGEAAHMLILRRQGVPGVWLIDIATNQVRQVVEKLVSKVFWIAPDKIVYIIDDPSDPDLGTWLQGLNEGSPIKLSTYRADSVTLIPETDQVLFAANNTLWEFDGTATRAIGTEGSYKDKGQFYWPPVK